MKTLISIFFAGAISIALVHATDPAEKAAEVARDTADTAKNVGKTAVRKTKEAVETVADVFTPEAGARHVNVTLTEYRIDMSASLKRGKTAFIVKNAGKNKHNFEVRGEGTDRRFLLDVSPQQTKVMHVDLKRGTYTAFCPEDHHQVKGMEVTLSVR